MSTMRTLEIDEIGKAYAGRQVVRGVNMQIGRARWWDCWGRTARARRPAST